MREVVSTYVARFATILSVFLLVPIVAPAVGYEEYGLYALVSSVGVLFAQDLGMASATTRFAARAWANEDDSELSAIAAASGVYFAFLACVLSGLFALALAALAAKLVIPPSVDYVALGALGVTNIFFAIAFSSHRQLASGIGRLDLVNMLLIGQACIRVFGTIIVLQHWVSVVAVAAVDLTATFAGGIAIWIMRRRVSSGTNFHARGFSILLLRQLFTFSLDILVMTIAAVVILQSGALLASLTLPLGAVAVYTAANRVFLLTREAANSLTIALLPVASRNSVSVVRDANRSLFIAGTRLANCALLVVLVPILVFTEPLLRAWVGDPLASGSLAAQILILSMLANNNHLIAVPILIGEGKIRTYAKLHVVWAVAGIALAPILAPVMGVAGIALALSLPVVVLEPIYVLVALRTLDVAATEYLRACVVIPYGLAALPAAVLFLYGESVSSVSTPGFAIALAAWLIVSISLYWTLAVTRDERRRVLQLIRRRDAR